MKLRGDLHSVEINVMRRSNVNSDDFWDANWLEAEIRIDVDGFKSLYGTTLRVDELQEFYKHITALQNLTSKSAEFRTIEEGLYLQFELEPNGSISCHGIAKNESGNSLDFMIETNLSFLDVFVDELKTALHSATRK